MYSAKNEADGICDGNQKVEQWLRDDANKLGVKAEREGLLLFRSQFRSSSAGNFPYTP